MLELLEQIGSLVVTGRSHLVDDQKKSSFGDLSERTTDLWDLRSLPQTARMTTPALLPRTDRVGQWRDLSLHRGGMIRTRAWLLCTHWRRTGQTNSRFEAWMALKEQFEL